MGAERDGRASPSCTPGGGARWMEAEKNQIRVNGFISYDQLCLFVVREKYYIIARVYKFKFK